MPEPAQPVDKAAVVAYAEHHGPAKAALVFGIKLGTVKTWLHRARAVKERNELAAGESASGSESESVSESAENQRGDSNGEHSQRTSAPTRRVKGTADEFLGKVRTQLHRMVDKVAGMRITEANIHRIATGLAKAEIAGRVPFGYGGDNSGQAAFGLLNVHVHNARHDSMPALAHEVQAEVMPLPAVSVETEDEKEEAS